jgi:hypothetical protein
MNRLFDLLKSRKPTDGLWPDSNELKVERMLLYYLGGYVARKLSKYSQCDECISRLKDELGQYISEADLVHLKSKGNLNCPSPQLFSLIEIIETVVQRHISYPSEDVFVVIVNELLKNTRFDVNIITCL